MQDAFPLLPSLQKSLLFQLYEQKLNEGATLLFEELMPVAKACITAEASRIKNAPLLVITGAGPEEFKLYNDLPFFTKNPLIELSAWETLPSENVAPSPDIVGSRFQALKTLSASKTAPIVLTTLQGCLQKILPRSFFKKSSFTLTTGQSITLEKFSAQLIGLGFERKSIVTDKGECAIRGGIVDLFPVTAENAFRIEFFGDEIDSIRAIDISSQKSTHVVQSLDVSCAKELELFSTMDAPLETIFDYLGKNCLVVLDDLVALEDRYAQLTSLGATPSKHFLGIHEFFDLIAPLQKVSFAERAVETLSDVQYSKNAPKAKFYSLHADPHEVTFEMFSRHFSAVRLQHPFERVGQFLEKECLLDEEPVGEALLDALSEVHEKGSLYYVVQSESEETALKKKLELRGIPSVPSQYIHGYLSSGFHLKDVDFTLFSMTDLTHRMKVRRERQRTSYHFVGTDAFDIAPGELIVHYHHGIGKFLGIEKRPNLLGIEQEFFLVEYADGAKMYVPLQQAHLITKYVGGGKEEMPRLHTIGASRWKKQRSDTEKAILGFANDLLKMYAERKVHGGFQFPSDSEETLAFDEEFPYVETEDQLQAIQEVKADMCQQKAMDRLVCGDVGYGKTEVALRAAFKAVMDGKKQVALLVPTTVLAVQHYENFIDRMESFGVTCGLLSRFQKPSEVKKILERSRAGKVDILIGTHRLLQEDVHFKDLGLVIIDEEQRFGVKAKEHLKRLKMGVDCLTLSATPIPRTLYMSVVGARDLSSITTPPQDRLPIKTIITDPDDTLIQTALVRELSRDGQVYFIHNRVETIYEVAERLKKLVPKARILVGHGQMSGDEIDLVFHTFKRGDADILVATTIIESGIDIPNANTIFIDNADHFGIADLYQLRGRVGRWNRRAFAYFLIPKRRALSEISRKRIEAIAQSGGYGGGMKVAMRDLEMRGAGDILGVEQSGHVTDIGFHLYCKLLKRTIDSMQGKSPTWTLETKIEIPYDARIPDSYVDDVQLRMEIYQRLGDAMTLEEVDTIFSEVKDRFGKPPVPSQWLYRYSRLRVFAAQKGLTLVKLDNMTLTYERKTGNESHSNKVLIGRIRTPEELEEKICKAII